MNGLFVTLLVIGVLKAQESVVSACGGSITLNEGDTGTLESPSYPSAYPSNSQCIWTISAPATLAVRFLINTFDLNSTVNSCTDHNLSFYDGASASEPLKADLTGCRTDLLQHYVPLSLSTTQSEATVVFRSGNNGDAQGFQVTYETTTVCGGAFSAFTNGWFASPNYPQNYDGFSDCTWAVRGYAGEQIQININDFDLEYNNLCSFDKVTIYGGLGVTTDILWESCDDAANFPAAGIEIVTDFTYVTVVLTSDYSVEAGGFNISYGFVPATVAPTSVIVTPEGFTTVIRASAAPSTMGPTTAEIPISMTPTMPELATTMGPTSDNPTTHAPTTHVPSIITSTTDLSTTAVPTTMAPTTSVPTSAEIHTTEGPTTITETAIPTTTASIIQTCQALPTWYNIEFDSPIPSADGPLIIYWCQEDYEFESDDDHKEAVCDLTTGEWHPYFKDCTEIVDPDALAAFLEPTEAKNAAVIGSTFAIITLGTEMGLIILLDVQLIFQCIDRWKRHRRRKAKQTKRRPTRQDSDRVQLCVPAAVSMQQRKSMVLSSLNLSLASPSQIIVDDYDDDDVSIDNAEDDESMGSVEEESVETV